MRVAPAQSGEAPKARTGKAGPATRTGRAGKAAPAPMAAHAPASPDQPSLALQRRAGNRAVTAAVLGREAERAGAPVLQRFGEEEHKSMGDTGSGGATLTLPGGIALTFGDITALAGDYFGSPEQIRTLAGTPGDKTKPGTVDEVNFALHVKIRGDHKESDYGPKVAAAVDARFYALAGTNLRHFTEPRAGDDTRSTDELAKARGTVPASAAAAYGVAKGAKVPVTNVGSYRENHEKALEAAAQAGAGGPATMNDAMLNEAFASHFLTDAYAGGHVRTPRAAVSDWWNPRVPMFWHNLQLWMAEVIARHLNDNALIPSALTVQQLYEMAQDTVRKAAAGMPALAFGDAVSGALHDMDNTEGVEARVGTEVVKLVGDGEVLDGKGRALAAGVPTAQKAAAGVAASLQEVRDAQAAGAQGLVPAAAIASIRLPDGLFRAEQLWPRALADSDPQQSNPSRTWQVPNAEQLFSDARMRVALTHFAHEKADTLGAAVKLEPPFRADKELALKETVVDPLKGDEANVIRILRAVVNYTPGSATGQTGGIFGHDEDDDAVTYYKAAKSKGALGTLTLDQRKRLVRAVLAGSTTGLEDTMVADLLTTASPSDATAVLKDVGWRWVWDDLSGDDLKRVVDGAGPAFWRTQPFPRKKAEVSFLAGGRTNDISQRAIIMILRTCAGPAEVRAIDSSLGWPGLDFDLTGSYQSEFDKLK